METPQGSSNQPNRQSYNRRLQEFTDYCRATTGRRFSAYDLEYDGSLWRVLSMDVLSVGNIIEAERATPRGIERFVLGPRKLTVTVDRSADARSLPEIGDLPQSNVLFGALDLIMAQSIEPVPVTPMSDQQ